MQILLSSTQAGPGRKVKQEQEEISRNHVPRLYLPLCSLIYLQGHRKTLMSPTSVTTRPPTSRRWSATSKPSPATPWLRRPAMLAGLPVSPPGESHTPPSDRDALKLGELICLHHKIDKNCIQKLCFSSVYNVIYKGDLIGCRTENGWKLSNI